MFVMVPGTTHYSSRLAPSRSAAVTGLQGENNLTTELGRLAAVGVQVQVCPNALHEHRIDPATMPDYAQTSLGGIMALVLAHQEGFVYVKP
jgi:intracellular sulfur oxidation DsrE/DsrF family protein